MKYLLLTILFAACKPPTPAQEVMILRAELSVSSTKCAVYLTDTNYPRDTIVTEKCTRLTVKP